MTGDARIRPATAEDAEALAEARRSTAAGEEGLLAARPHEVSAKEIRSRITRLRPEGLFVVLEERGKPIAHLTLERLGLEATRHVVDLSIVVHAGHTGRGHGRRLMEHAIDWSRRAPDVEKIELRVRSNNPRAIGLYESLGFTVEGTLRRRLQLREGYADDLCMALFVDGPDARGADPAPARG